MARGRHRPRVGLGRPPPVVVLAGARHAGDPRPLVSPRASGAGARDHDPAARIGPGAAVAALCVAARHRPGQRRRHPGPAECLAGDARDRVPAAAEPGPACRGPRLVLHVERQGSGGPRGPGRAAARRAPRPARRPGGLGQGTGGSSRRRPARLRVSPGRRSRRAAPPGTRGALRESCRPAGRAGARRCGGRRRGAGGQPVPQGVKRTVRELSSRFVIVRRLRIRAWRWLERGRAGKRHGERAGGQ